MEYNIGFVIGDPSGDGHACTTEYHIVANHSVDEISEAYKKTTELLGFDFVKEVGVEFQSDPWIPEKFTKKLLELEIIDKEYVIESDSEYGTPAGCYEFECAEDEFVDIYFAIAKYFLPDLTWRARNLEEEILWDLERCSLWLLRIMENKRIPRKNKESSLSMLSYIQGYVEGL